MSRSYSPSTATHVMEGEAVGLLDAVGGSGESRRDGLLQAVRRVDWRFLLREPQLDHVALLGDDDIWMVQALRWFSKSLSLLDVGWSFPDGQAPRFDVAVLRSARLTDLAKAAAILEPGGALYWEIERRFTWRRLRALARRRASRARLGPCRLRAIESELEKHGFEAIRFHWHRPSFQNAVEVIPLDGDAAVDFALGRHRGRLRGQVKRMLARALRRTGLLRVLVPALSVVAYKPATATDSRATVSRASENRATVGRATENRVAEGNA